MLQTSPHSAPPADPLAEPIRQALAAAGDVAGAYLDAPCGFMTLPASVGRVVADLGPGGDGEWVLVTCRQSSEAGHQSHLRERCRTAAQRFTLSLWSDGVDARWITDGLPSSEEFSAAGVDLTSAEPLGLVWCGIDG